MKKEKLSKLQEAQKKLKADFVGLDSIIDKVIDSISPWYLTPEILERPVIVSLWGLTGTGKTSLVRKLINYLGLIDKSLFFDCGEQGGAGNSGLSLFSEKLDDLFESSSAHECDPRFTEDELSILGITDDPTNEQVNKTDPLDYTLVFDEFQYLKTKDPDTGNEESRPEGRAIWNLLDSGLVDINNYNYKLKNLVNLMEDLEFFSEEHPGVAISSGKFKDPNIKTLLKQQLAYYRWFDEEEEGVDKDSGYPVFLNDDFSYLIKRLNLVKKGLGFLVGDKINSITTLHELIQYLKTYIDIISRPKVINCSKSLIFVLGNLDEAFDLTDEDLDPDVDADVYHEMTSKVNCMDIKEALRKRFRDEQVGRLGNNIIIYPSLRRCDFEEIIRRELARITDRFKSTTGISLKISPNLSRLIYSEGCFPIQGVRPLFSTINTLLSPLMSAVLLDKKSSKEYNLDVKETDFDVSEATFVVTSARGRIVEEKKLTLSLGTLRSPDRCKKIGLQAIHEASHAVLYKYLTDQDPSAIIASNVFGNGGYMMDSIDPDSSTENVKDLQNNIIISLAGYYGEREFFDSDLCSLGASSDLECVWEQLRTAFYESGLSVPIRVAEPGTSSQNLGLPLGLSHDKGSVQSDLTNFFNDCCKETKRLISQESRVIGEVALRLCDKSSMKIEDFKNLISKYGIGFKTRKLTPDNYYIRTIKKRLNHE